MISVGSMTNDYPNVNNKIRQQRMPNYNFLRLSYNGPQNLLHVSATRTWACLSAVQSSVD